MIDSATIDQLLHIVDELIERNEEVLSCMRVDKGTEGYYEWRNSSEFNDYVNIISETTHLRSMRICLKDFRCDFIDRASPPAADAVNGKESYEQVLGD